MPVVEADVKNYKSSTMAVDTTTTNLGGAISATQITGASLSEVLFLMAANPTGGADQTQCQKIFSKNTNSTSDLTASAIYLRNSLDNVGSNGVVTVSSTSASDSSSYMIRVLGFDGSGSGQQEDIPLNGTTPANGVLTFSAVHRVEMRNASTGALTNAVGDITIKCNSVTLGILPKTRYSATGEVQIWLEASLDGSTTNGSGQDCTVAPSGSSFSKPRTSSGGLAVGNGQVLTHGHAQPLWVLWTLKAGAKPSGDMQVIVTTYGLAA